jgi:hypothetical protein
MRILDVAKVFGSTPIRRRLQRVDAATAAAAVGIAACGPLS